MIWIILSIVAYIASCAWYWYEVHIDNTKTDGGTVIFMFIPLFNLPYPIMNYIFRINTNKFFKIDNSKMERK